MAQWYKRVNVNATVVCSIPTRENELVFRSGNTVHEGVEIRHSTRNASTIREKWKQSLNEVPFAYPPLCGTQREAKKI